MFFFLMFFEKFLSCKINKLRFFVLKIHLSHLNHPLNATSRRPKNIVISKRYSKIIFKRSDKKWTKGVTWQYFDKVKIKKSSPRRRDDERSKKWDEIVMRCKGYMVEDRGAGDDRLSRVLRRSIIGARGFNGRVRNGIGWDTSAVITGSSILC